MKYAENNRISCRQLYRQTVLSFLAPFLLCLPGGGLTGFSGIAGLILAAGILCAYVLVLLRIVPGCCDLVRSLGIFGGRLAGVFLLVYVFYTAVYLLQMIAEIVPVWLVNGIPDWILQLAVILVCSFGAHRGMQRRGRMAEAAGGLVLSGVLAMLILCAGQAKAGYAKGLGQAHFTAARVLRQGYLVLCGFSGTGLLPFSLKDVEKRGKAGKTVILSIVTLSAVLLAALILMPAVLGWQRVQKEEYPVLPLLAGADLPGNVLARFDVLWMGFLLFSLLFAVGSLFHYGYQIFDRAHLGSGRWWFLAAVFLLSILAPNLKEQYIDYLEKIFVPGLVILHIFLLTSGRYRKIRKASAAAAAVLVLFMLSGCASTEPEKRMYPLALGVEKTDGIFRLSYGMPDLSQTTGQDKPEEDGGVSVLSVAGKDFAEIETVYTQSQQKYLDMGHLMVILISSTMEETNDGLPEFLEYLKQEPAVGENVYIFSAENPEEILKWNDGSSSLGEYLTDLMENQKSSRQEDGVTLRQVYKCRYAGEALPALPEVIPDGTGIRVVFPESVVQDKT